MRSAGGVAARVALLFSDNKLQSRAQRPDVSQATSHLMSCEQPVVVEHKEQEQLADGGAVDAARLHHRPPAFAAAELARVQQIGHVRLWQG